MRSALSSLLGVLDGKPIGQLPLVKRFMKGIFNKKPALPKYNSTWDVEVVLAFLKTLTPVHTLSLRYLSYKLVMLLALLTGQRMQTLHSLDLNDIEASDSQLTFSVNALLKSSRPGSHLKPIIIPAFPDDKTLCLVSVFSEYVKRTKTLRKTQKLIVTYSKPHSHASKCTLSKWIKDVLKLSGIDISQYKSHSTRSASTSAAKKAGASVSAIMNAAGWTQESTFRKFYDKPVTIETYEDNFSVRVLRCGK